MSSILRTVLVGDDTYLLVRLLFRANCNSNRIYYSQEAKQSAAWDIDMIKTSLGTELCNSIIFCNALFGFDTTSHTHGVEKGKAMGIFKDDAFRRSS